jgi:hypothetical protein
VRDGRSNPHKPSDDVPDKRKGDAGKHRWGAERKTVALDEEQGSRTCW